MNNNSLLPTQGDMGKIKHLVIRNQAPSIPPILGGGNWMSSIVYGGLAGVAVSLISKKNTVTARRNRGFGLLATAVGTGFALKQPGWDNTMLPHLPSMLGSAVGYIVAANLLGMNLKMPSPLQEVLPSWSVRAGR